VLLIFFSLGLRGQVTDHSSPSLSSHSIKCKTLSLLTHWLLVTRILVIKWVCQDANMTSLLVMELRVVMGGI